MLSAKNRLTAPGDFREVVRRGHRCGGPLMVVHLWVRAGGDAGSAPQAGPSGGSRSGSNGTRSDRPSAEPRVGFVVSKAVGPAVRRNLVKRRLRHLARARTGSIPSHGMLVVRALPAAAGVSYDDLGAELDRCLDRCRAKIPVSGAPSSRTEVGG